MNSEFGMGNAEKRGKEARKLGSREAEGSKLKAQRVLSRCQVSGVRKASRQILKPDRRLEPISLNI